MTCSIKYTLGTLKFPVLKATWASRIRPVLFPRSVLLKAGQLMVYRQLRTLWGDLENWAQKLGQAFPEIIKTNDIFLSSK